MKEIIERRTDKGSIIFTDGCKGHSGIDELGYQLFTFNHSKEWTDKETWRIRIRFKEYGQELKVK